MEWMLRELVLAERISSVNWVMKPACSYFAFEALGDHGYYFQGINHGNFPEVSNVPQVMDLPEVLAVDGSVKAATDDVILAQFAMTRQERYLDAEFQHQLLKLSIMFPMLFSTRLRFVTEASPTFGPFNRVSNLVLQTARGSMLKEGPPEIGDGSHINHFL